MLRSRSGQYTTAEKARRALWARHDRAMAVGYAEGARAYRGSNQFTATGLDMLNRLAPATWVKTTPEAMGRVRGRCAGQVALWAGVDLQFVA